MSTEILMDGMDATTYLREMNRELMAMGLKPVSSIEEARRTNRPATDSDLFSTAAEKAPQPGGMKDVKVYNGEAPRNLATESQIKFIKNLLASRDMPGSENAFCIGLESEIEAGTLSKRDASEAIDRLKAYPWRKREAAITPAARPAQTSSGVTEDGMYRKDGVIYKVQIAKQGSGNLYAKVLVQDGGETYFEYAPGAIRQLKPEHKMTLEEAKEFGHLYGVCCVCAAELTDEKSIAAGIGPVCGKRF